MIVHEHGKWVLKTQDGSRVLGTHATKEEAEAQERVIEMHKHEKKDTVTRYDRVEFTQDALAKPQVTPEGFWKVTGRLARTGIQEYHRADGTVIKELRTPAEVNLSAPGFALKPLTNQHPPAMVTPDNAKEYVCGAIGEAKFDGKWITAPITVYDQDAIKAMRAGRAQVSAGYSCEVIEEPGEWDGEHYDSRQVGIQINHVAIVDFARAGDEARIRLDSAGAISSDLRFLSDSEPVIDSTKEDIKPMAITFKLDDMELQVADSNQETFIRRLHADKVSAIARADGLAAEKEKLVAEKLTAEAVAKQRQDEAEAAKNEFKTELPKRADALAQFWKECERLLGSNYAVNGRDETTLKRAVVKQYLPKMDGIDSLTGEGLDSAFKGAKSVALEKSSRVELKDDGIVVDANDPESARKRMIERNKAAFVGNKEQN